MVLCFISVTFLSKIREDERYGIFPDLLPYGQDLDSYPYANLETSLLLVVSESWGPQAKRLFPV